MVATGSPVSLRLSTLCNHPPVNHLAAYVSVTGMQLHRASDCIRASRIHLAAQGDVLCLNYANPEPMPARLIRDELANELAFVHLVQPSARQSCGLPILDGDSSARSQRLHASESY